MVSMIDDITHNIYEIKSILHHVIMMMLKIDTD